MQWRMVGRRGRDRDVDDRRRRRRSRRGRCPTESAAARAAAIEGKDAPRVPPLDQLPQLLRDLRVRRGVRRAGRPRRRPADRRPRRPGSRRARCRPATSRPARPRGRADRRSPARSPGTVGDRGTGRPPRRGRRAGWRRGRSSPTTRRRRTRPTPAAAGDDRIVVLTGIDTKGLEFDGIVVVDPDAIEAESLDRPRHALRRPHPRHPAAHPDPL